MSLSKVLARFKDCTQAVSNIAYWSMCKLSRLLSLCCRFYPLYPAPLGTCLDLTADPALMLQQLPHMLLLPSDLAPFAKLVAAAAATATGGGYAVPNSPGRWCSGFVGYLLACNHMYTLVCYQA